MSHRGNSKDVARLIRITRERQSDFAEEFRLGCSFIETFDWNEVETHSTELCVSLGRLSVLCGCRGICDMASGDVGAAWRMFDRSFCFGVCDVAVNKKIAGVPNELGGLENEAGMVACYCLYAELAGASSWLGPLRQLLSEILDSRDRRFESADATKFAKRVLNSESPDTNQNLREQLDWHLEVARDQELGPFRHSPFDLLPIELLCKGNAGAKGSDEEAHPLAPFMYPRPPGPLNYPDVLVELEVNIDLFAP